MARFAVILIAVICAPILIAQQPALVFEVASVRPSSPNPIPATAIGSFRLPPDRRRGLRVNLVQYIGVAYPEYAFEGRVIGGPAWVREALFDIEAKKDPTTSLAQVAPMMAHLLAERFALRTHIEQRPVNVYVLKMARDDRQFGPQLKRSAASCIEAKTARQPLPPECRGTPLGGSGLNVTTSEVAELLRILSGMRIDRPVLDRTGLTGYFDFRLRYDYGPFGFLAGSVRTEGLSFFTALQEQLGLKIEPTREVIDVLVIDSAEMPTPD